MRALGWGWCSADDFSMCALLSPCLFLAYSLCSSTQSCFHILRQQHRPRCVGHRFLTTGKNTGVLGGVSRSGAFCRHLLRLLTSTSGHIQLLQVKKLLLTSSSSCLICPSRTEMGFANTLACTARGWGEGEFPLLPTWFQGYLCYRSRQFSAVVPGGATGVFSREVFVCPNPMAVDCNAPGPKGPMLLVLLMLLWNQLH